MLFLLNRLKYRSWALVGLLGVTLLSCLPLNAAEPLELALSLGKFSVLDSTKGLEAGGEVRFAPRRLRFQPRWLPEVTPMAGLMVTAGGTLYAYAGYGLQLPFGRGWSLRPSWGTGMYHQHREVDLGGAIEFRSAIEISRRLRNGARLGLTFYHLSNAGLFELNPGAESLVFTFATRP